MIKFGNIFRYKESIYIYLAAKGDGVTLYVSQIFSDTEIIHDFIQSRSGLFAIRATDPVRKNNLSIAHCFIILTTAGFENQMAHLGKSDEHNANMAGIEQVGELCREDIEELKKEILENENVLPMALVKYVRELGAT